MKRVIWAIFPMFLVVGLFLYVVGPHIDFTPEDPYSYKPINNNGWILYGHDPKELASSTSIAEKVTLTINKEGRCTLFVHQGYTVQIRNLRVQDVEKNGKPVGCVFERLEDGSN